MNLHGFVGAGFPRKTCAICGRDAGHATHAVLTSDELAAERERFLARRRESMEDIRRVRIPVEEQQQTKGGNRKQRGEG